MIKRDRQSGVTTIAAVMMIIILGILGAAFVSLIGSEQYGYLNHYESAQSFYSASAGVEWGMHEMAPTASAIPFAGGTVTVSLVDNALIATGTAGRGERVIQIQTLSISTESPSAGCESFTISDRPTYTPYTTVYNNPTGGVGDTVYVKVKTTRVVDCTGGTATLQFAEVRFDNLQCPGDNVTYDTVGDWSCSGPTTGGGCTDYYEYTTAVELPSDWSDTTASLSILLDDQANKFTGNEIVTIGKGDCSSVKFYSDSGYTTQVSPWEFEKGSSYYVRVITDNLDGNSPKNNNGILIIEDLQGNIIFEDNNFFSLNGTQDISCDGATYSYGSYEGIITIPNAAPGGGSDWTSEPTADWYYNFKVYLDATGGNCQFDYRNTLKFTASVGGGGGPLDEALSEATATTSDAPTGGDWYGAKGAADMFIIKLINETASDLILTGVELSCTAAQGQLIDVSTKTAANGWSSNTVWSGAAALPTGLLTLDQGVAGDKTIPAGSHIVMDGFSFDSNILPGTFTLIVYFDGGESSTLTFDLP